MTIEEAIEAIEGTLPHPMEHDVVLLAAYRKVENDAIKFANELSEAQAKIAEYKSAFKDLADTKEKDFHIPQLLARIKELEEELQFQKTQNEIFHDDLHQCAIDKETCKHILSNKERKIAALEDLVKKKDAALKDTIHCNCIKEKFKSKTGPHPSRCTETIAKEALALKLEEK